MGIEINPGLTAEVARRVFSYEERSGLLIWREHKHRTMVGRIASTEGANGYLAVRYADKTHMAHRVVWLMAHGEMPPMLDHIDGNRQNNRLANLRLCTHAQNGQNSKLSKASRTGFKGVTRVAAHKWRARIQAFGTVYEIGCFYTRSEAAAAYDAAALRHHKEFARTNGDLAEKSEPFLECEANIQYYRPKHWRWAHLGY